jgi:hypothetical protein
MAKTLTFIANSGATFHMCGSLEGKKNFKPLTIEIMVGTKSIGIYKAFSRKMDKTITLKDVLNIPNHVVNVSSLTKAVETQVVQRPSNGQIVTLNLGKSKYYFDKVFKRGSGSFLGIEIYPNPNNIAVLAHTLDIVFSKTFLVIPVTKY